MDAVEKIGLMPAVQWHLQYKGADITPSDIGVIGPYVVDGRGLLVMACDEHMDSETWNGDGHAAYALARQYQDLYRKLALYERPGRTVNPNLIARHALQVRALRSQIAAIEKEPLFPESKRINGAREWFIAHAVWIEV